MPQRFSQQRERIYQTVLESRAHPTAEMVYQQLKPEMPRLSLGTVYRNLQQMAREGRLTELDGPVTRFDAVTRPHTHFRWACGCARGASGRSSTAAAPAGLCWIWRLCPMTRGWTVWLRPGAAWSRATP